MAERAVQTIKNMFRKTQDDNKDPYLALMELRNSKIPGVKLFPAQLLLWRNTRTLIPTVKSSLRPMEYNTEKVLEELQNLAERPRSYFVSHGNTTLWRNRRYLIKQRNETQNNRKMPMNQPTVIVVHFRITCVMLLALILEILTCQVILPHLVVAWSNHLADWLPSADFCCIF